MRRITPAEPGAIIGAGAREVRNPAAYFGPIQTRGRDPGFKHNRGTRAILHQMQLSIAARPNDVDHSAGRRIPAAIRRRARRLVNRASNDERGGNRKNNDKNRQQTTILLASVEP